MSYASTATEDTESKDVPMEFRLLLEEEPKQQEQWDGRQTHDIRIVPLSVNNVLVRANACNLSSTIDCYHENKPNYKPRSLAHPLKMGDVLAYKTVTQSTVMKVRFLPV